MKVEPTLNNVLNPDYIALILEAHGGLFKLMSLCPEALQHIDPSFSGPCAQPKAALVKELWSSFLATWNSTAVVVL